MRSLRRFLSRLFNSAARRAHDRRIREEIEEHIALQTEEHLRAGLSPLEARRQAILRFGSVEAIREDYRAERGLPGIENLLRDARFAVRVLRRSPGFTVTAVVTLAMAIGANAVVFGVLNAMILRPLNLPQEETLFSIERGKDKSAAQSYPDYLDLRDRNRSFDRLAAYTMSEVGLDAGEGPSRVWIEEVSGNYFDALRIQPYLGRFIHPSDERGPNSAPYIVLTHAYWHAHFRDDRAVVGRTVRVNKRPFTIVGVAPPGFHGDIAFFNPAFFVPIVNQEHLNDRGDRSLSMVMGHLNPGVTPAQAVADLNAIGSSLAKTYPKEDGQMSFALTHASLGGDDIAPLIRAFLTGLMLLAGLILLAACANLGSLFAARAADRSREVALRLALGASRMRILRQLLTEAVLVSLMGGAVGLWGSVLLLHGLSVWQPVPRFPLSMPVNPDARVYAVALLLSLVSGLLFGAVPVKQVLRADPYEIIKVGSTGRIGWRMGIRDALLVVQVALCAVLITSSMVAVRGLVRSLHSNLGFEPRNAMVVDFDLQMAGYSRDKVPGMQNRIIEAMETITGAGSVGLIDQLPLEFPNATDVFADNTADLSPSNVAASVVTCNISPAYFRAAGTRLLAGRAFTSHDDGSAPRVAVVNQEFSRKIFGSATGAIDRYYRLKDGTRVQVAGIVEDGKYGTLTEDPQPAMFLPILQSPSSGTYLVVRSDRDPQQLAGAMTSTLRGLDAGLPFEIRTWNRAMDTALFVPQLAAISLGVLGVMGAMLSITGIFGMAAHSVGKRLRELGIRVALGAERREVLQAALGRAFTLLICGSVAGLLLGLLASRVLAAIVYQATPRDPFVLAGVVLAMSLLGLLATWIPARRALKVDPARLLRAE